MRSIPDTAPLTLRAALPGETHSLLTCQFKHPHNKGLHLRAVQRRLLTNCSSTLSNKGSRYQPNRELLGHQCFSTLSIKGLRYPIALHWTVWHFSCTLTNEGDHYQDRLDQCNCLSSCTLTNEGEHYPTLDNCMISKTFLHFSLSHSFSKCENFSVIFPFPVR